MQANIKQQTERVGGRHNVGKLERVVSSMVGGALLISALRSPSPRKLAGLLGGAALLHRGVTGHCYAYSALGRNTTGRRERSAVQQSITIGKSTDELYRLWQDPEHVAAIMRDFAQVEDLGSGRWRWTVSLPKGRSISWMTRRTAQRPGELIAWRTEEGTPFAHAGSVQFRAAPRDLGTEVTLRMSFGQAPVKLFEAIPRVLEESILRHCKSLCEAGEIPTLQHNPDARKPKKLQRAAEPLRLAPSPQTARSLS